MAKELKLLNAFDVTDKTHKAGTESVSITDFQGQLAKMRKFQISDNKGEISAFSTRGALFRNKWRNQDVEYKDDSSQIQFKGAITKVGQKVGDKGNIVTIDASEGVGPLLDASVESNDSSTHSGFLVDNTPGYEPGDQVIKISGGSTDIPIPSIVSFTNDLVPRYQVVSTDGSPTDEITLDRPLEKALNDGDSIRVSVPVYKSAPGEIRDTLTTIGLGDRLGLSFNQLDSFDISNNYLFFINVTYEERISVANHIGKLLELSDSFLSVSDSGVIDIVRGFEYKGESVDTNYLSKDEIIPEVSLDYNVTKLIFNYNVLYLSGGEVRVAKGEADPIYINQYANKKSWNPIPQAGNIAGEYNYLFANAISAGYFAQRILDFYSVPRAEVIMSIKGFYHKQPLKFINLQLGKQYFLSFDITENDVFFDEPAKVIAYTRDLDNQKYTGVKFWLSNWLQPNLPRDVGFPIFPEVIASYNINNGAAVVIPDIANQLLLVEIYNSAKQLLRTQTKSVANGQLSLEPRGLYFQILDDLVFNSNTYYFKLQTKSGNNYSDKTDFYQFIPAIQDSRVGYLEVGVFTIP